MLPQLLNAPKGSSRGGEPKASIHAIGGFFIRTGPAPAETGELPVAREGLPVLQA